MNNLGFIPLPAKVGTWRQRSFQPSVPPTNLPAGVVKYTFPSEVVVETGTVVFQPIRNIFLLTTYMHVGIASYLGDVIVDILINGVSILNGNYIRIPVNTLTSNNRNLQIQAFTTDHLTVNVLSANGAKDAALYILYE